MCLLSSDAGPAPLVLYCALVRCDYLCMEDAKSLRAGSHLTPDPLSTLHHALHAVRALCTAFLFLWFFTPVNRNILKHFKCSHAFLLPLHLVHVSNVILRQLLSTLTSLVVFAPPCSLEHSLWVWFPWKSVSGGEKCICQR